MKMRYILLALALAGTLSGCGKAEPSAQAVKSYQELLMTAPAIKGVHPELEDAAFGSAQNRAQFGQHYDAFALVDINQDGLPELIASTVINFRWVPKSVFTFAEGKAVLLRDPLEEAANGTFEQNSAANGAYVTFLCPDHHIHSLWRGSTPVGEMEENHAYALEGTTLTAVDCPAAEGVFFSDIAKTNTTENVAGMSVK